MSAISKYNHISKFPRYHVEYVSYKTIQNDQPNRVSWCGSYQSKFGVQPYVDMPPVMDGGDYLRVRLPKWTLKDIDEIAHDSEAMADIAAGKVGVIFHALHTENGDTITIEWVDM